MSPKPAWGGAVTRHPKTQKPTRTRSRTKVPSFQQRRAPVVAKSFDAETGTFEAVVATETPVRRWFGNEILRCARGAIDTVRLTSAPLLDSHRTGSIGDIVGQVSGFRIEGNTLLCTFRLADSELGRRASQLLAEGMLKSVSVGYQVLDYDRERRQDGETDVTVTRWQPYEVSLVSVPPRRSEMA